MDNRRRGQRRRTRRGGRRENDSTSPEVRLLRDLDMVGDARSAREVVREWAFGCSVGLWCPSCAYHALRALARAVVRWDL